MDLPVNPAPPHEPVWKEEEGEGGHVVSGAKAGLRQKSTNGPQRGAPLGTRQRRKREGMDGDRF
jgi:hypothetical protein